VTAVLAVLYDIHGNTAALDAVLREAEAMRVDRYLLGGDYGTPSPAPLETLERLRALPNATWIRGNGERWLREPPPDSTIRAAYAALDLSEDVVDELYGLPASVELEGILFVHGSPLADDESFAPEPGVDDERLLIGVHDRTVVFGHSHRQFRRKGPRNTELVNPGSVGMPLDGDVRAAWATWDGDFTFRRTEYDVDRAAAAFRAMGGDFADRAAARILNGSA
jgi:diadenosine tetraphosphatase ApaH/serine/threonine PP2A family protein phosphatase